MEKQPGAAKKTARGPSYHIWYQSLGKYCHSSDCLLLALALASC